MTSPVIAIDGPSAAGKGTLARRLARELGFDYLDTGALYRAVGVKALARTDEPGKADMIAAAQDLGVVDGKDPNLRTEQASFYASIAADIPEVRAALLAYQRRFAQSPPGDRGAVLDGRDIGTVICPDASVKLFVTASPKARAYRRWKELRERGEAAIEARVLQDLQERDRRDESRVAAPLKPAEDAVVLDTTELDADQAFAKALAIVQQRLSANPKA